MTHPSSLVPYPRLQIFQPYFSLSLSLSFFLWRSTTPFSSFLISWPCLHNDIGVCFVVPFLWLLKLSHAICKIFVQFRYFFVPSFFLKRHEHIYSYLLLIHSIAVHNSTFSINDITFFHPICCFIHKFWTVIRLNYFMISLCLLHYIF